MGIFSVKLWVDVMPKRVNNGGGLDTWRTPQDLFEALNEQYKFEVDLCADVSNHKVAVYCTELEKEDLNKWKNGKSVAWINPPFSKAKELLPLVLDSNINFVGIFRSDNLETKLWHQILASVDWVFFPTGRINYTDPTGAGRNGSLFPSALFGTGVAAPKCMIGVLVYTNNFVFHELHGDMVVSHTKPNPCFQCRFHRHDQREGYWCADHKNEKPNCRGEYKR